MKAKDFITCGVFSVLSMVGMLLAAIINVSGYTAMFYPVMASFFMGILFVILINKVSKRGAVLAFSIVPALYYLTTGLIEGIIGILGVLIFGALSEWILWNNHDDMKRIVLASSVYTLYCSTIGMAENFLFTDRYCDSALEHGINAKVVEDMRAMYSIKLLWAVVIVLTALFTVAGAMLAKRIMKNHLEKVGLV